MFLWNYHVDLDDDSCDELTINYSVNTKNRDLTVKISENMSKEDIWIQI